MTSPYDVMAPFHACIAERDAALAELRREDPVHWDAANHWWLVTRHADEAIDALADRRSAEFVSELAVPVPTRSALIDGLDELPVEW